MTVIEHIITIMRSEVVEKLEKAINKFCLEEDTFTQEMFLVYIMVELRKLLDHDIEREKFTILRFYADWCVHTSKNKINNEMKSVFEELYIELNENKKEPALVGMRSNVLIEKLVNKNDLKNELESFLAKNNIEVNLKDCWDEFVNSLIKILQHQPIINKEDSNIRRLEFIPSNDYTFILEIEFKYLETGKYEIYKAGGVI